MLSDEVRGRMLGGEPRYHEEIGIFSERPEPSRAAMISIAVDDRGRRDLGFGADRGHVARWPARRRLLDWAIRAG